MRKITAIGSCAALSLTLFGCSTGPDEQTQAAIDAINAIGEVTFESSGTIEEAQSAYDGLDDKQKEKVDNLDVLEAAQDTFDGLKADEVTKLIDGIGEVTLDKEDQIKDARSAYTTLTSDQRMKVTNDSTLSAAESTLKNLKMAFNVGETIETNDWSITLTNACLTDRLSSPKTDWGYDPSDDAHTFLLLEFDIKCLSASHPVVDGGAFSDIIATCGTGTYSGFELQYIVGDMWLYFYNTYMEQYDADHIYVYTQVPKEAVNADQPVSVSLKIDGADKKIVIR